MLAALLATVLAATAASSADSADAAGGDQPGFQGHAASIRGQVRERIVGSSWHRGCPVALPKLRLVEVTYRGFDGDRHRGRLVVHRTQSEAVSDVMRRLYRIDYPIRRMELVDRYGADDHRSMAADNTSAFNCRFVAGTNRWSMHAYGRAIDVNPVENPYVSGSHVSPPAGARFADRSSRAPGVIHRHGFVVRAFRRIGWEWGGNWSSPKEYQHFSATGN